MRDTVRRNGVNDELTTALLLIYSTDERPKPPQKSIPTSIHHPID